VVNTKILNTKDHKGIHEVAQREEEPINDLFNSPCYFMIFGIAQKLYIVYFVTEIL
jgi:hypothetical protein